MGFDNECILNIQSLAGEYFCPVCRTLVYPNEALQSQCSHLYCRLCLTYVVGATRACPYDGYLVTEADSKPLIESNKALAETIGRIAVHCLFHRSGCTWQGPLSECTTHCSGCAFGHSPVVCNRCGIQIVHRQVQEHAQTCPGVNLQAQQVADVVQESVTSAAAATAANQTQTGTQSGAPPSQAQPQVVAVPTTQGQAATTAAQPTQEQQHQQSYQHVYDPYQFYAQQQLATQQFQPNVQGQLQPQVHTQPQAPSQAQQHHHHQPQPQTHSQPQPQVPPHGQPQYNAYAQVPVAQHNQAQVNAQQLHPVVQPHIQDISQSYPPPHGLVPLQAQPYLHPRPQPVQPHQQHMQTPQYQHPHAQMEPQQQQHSQTHTQASQLHPPPQIHPQLSPPVPNVQPQSQQPSSQAVTGHHSYPQVQAHQQMIPAPPPQSPSHTQPSSGSLPPAQIRGQFPPPPPQVRPPQSHTLLPNQQPPALLPSQGQVPNIPPAQQQQIHPHTPQPGHAVQQRPVTLQIQQPVPQQYAQQPFPGQIGPVQTQLHQHTPFAQHQPMQSQLHPQGPPHAMQQSSPALLQPQQGVALAHDVHSHPSQNYVGRPAVPNLGVQPQPFSQYSGAFGVPSQVRSMQLGSNQTSGHQSQQFGPSIKTTMERKGDVLSDGTVVKQEAGSPSQKTVGKGDNGGRADSLNVKALKSETGLKFLHDEHKPLESEDNSRHSGTLAKDIDSKVHALKDGFGEPVVKQTVKEEGNDHSVEANNVSMQSSVGIDSGSQALPPPPTSNRDGSNQNAIPHGNIQSPLVSRDCMQHSYQGTTQGLGFDESGGLGKGFMHSSHPGPFTDQGRHQLPPMPYGPSTHHQRPGILSMFQSGPLPGPPSNEQAPGYLPNLLRPQGPGHLSQPGQPLNPPEHYLAPGSKQHGSSHPDTSLGGFPSSGSTVLFGTGPGHFGNLQRSFELQSSAPQKQYGESHMPLPHVGFPMSSQGEPVGGKALGAAPPGSFDPQGGIRGRAPPLVYESQFGPQHPINPVQLEMFHSQRPHDFDGRHPNSHVPGYLERGSFGQPSGIESGKPRMNGAPGQDTSSTIGLRDERFKSIIEERPDPFSIGQTRQFDQEFEEGSEQLPRHSHLGLEASPKFGSYFSSSRTTDRGPNGLGLDASLRPLDKPPRGFNYDAGLKMDSGYGGVPSRFLPPYHTGGVLHPNDAGERAPSFGGNDDSGGRADSARAHKDILGSVLGFGLHHMEHLTPRSPGREYLGISSRGFGQSSFVDIDSREPHSFGEGSRSFNLPPDQGGNSSRGSRFPILPGHLRRGELGGPGNSQMGEHLRAELIGQDNLPILFRRGELLGHHNLSSHLPLGELDGPGSFPHHQPFGESFSGTKVSHPRLGEPGFRSSYSIHGFPNDGGFHLGDTSSFDQLRKRKPASMGWCRICEVDCETVEGLELHSQTREHQKMTMDMVIKIKQQNAKKHKISNDHSRGDASKSRNAGFEGRANKP